MNLPVFPVVLAAALTAAGTMAGALPNSVRLQDGKVTVSPGPQDLRRVLVDLCRQAGARLYLDPRIRTTVEPDCREIPLEKALVRILGSRSHTITWRPDPGGTPAWRMDEVRVYLDRRDDARLEWSPETADGAPSGEAGIPDLAAAIANADDDAEARRAAEQLAAIGSPAAADALFMALDDLPAGARQDAVARAAAGITNQAAASVVAAYLAGATDPAVVRAATGALASLADSALLRTLEGAHRTRPDDTAYVRVLDVIRRSSDPAAEAALIAWAGAPGTESSTPLSNAAREGLASLATGSAIDALVERLARAAPGDAAALADIVAGTAPTPEGLAALRHAAAGNKTADSDPPRVAAICGLVRFPDGETLALLQSLEDDPSPAVRDAAANALRELTGSP